MELSEVAWKVEETRDGACFRWGTVGRDFVAVWAGVLAVRAASDGSPLLVETDPNAPPELVEKTQNGIARAFLRAIVGKVSLHASAVTDGRTATLLIGPSGAGKSTMAASLCTRHGFRLLADDVAAVDFESGSWVVPPTESKVWLSQTLNERGGALPDKHPVPTAQAAAPARLGRVLALDLDDSRGTTEPSILRGTPAVARFLRAAIRFEATARSMTSELETAAALLSQAPVWAFTRPRSMPATRAAERVANALAAPPAGAPP